jgi:hypothetical protein
VGGVSVGQQSSDVNIEQNMIIGWTDILDQQKQNIDKRSRYGFVKIDREQQSLDKKFIELDKKLEYNLSKVFFKL